MFTRLRTVVAAFVFTTACLSAPAADDTGGWKAVTQTRDLTVYERPRKGSALTEHKAVGLIAAEPIMVKRVIDDTEEYPKFMPYVIETKTISRTEEKRIGYQRISPPIVGDRDYTVRITFETKATPEGVSYCNRWEAANELGPPEKKGVVRIKITEGYWLLEPAPNGQTKATYFIYCDSGGSLPTFLLNSANKTAIPKLFDAIRQQVKLEKYRK